MKIAIVGAGISGLVAAYHLHRDHEITVYESNSYVGGHTNTLDVVFQGDQQTVDTGFIVFNDWTYPCFEQLLSELGVESQPTTMSFSVRDESTGLEYNGHSLNTLFAQRRNLLRPSFYRLLCDILRFNSTAESLQSNCDPETTVGEFLRANRFSESFARHYLLPLGSAIWSCPTGTFADFPIRFIVEFYRNHGLLNVRRRPTWRVVRGGSKSYVRALIRPFEKRIRTNTSVIGVRRTTNGVDVAVKDQGTQLYDHVIFACHSDQALKILGNDATRTEREVLSAFPYSRSTAVLHTDCRRLPRSRRAWASWNYCVRAGQGEHAPSSVTYNMNLLQGLRSPHTYCVTLNDERIAADRILATVEYHHPVFTSRRQAAQARHSELLGANRTSYCGAYWRNGFHEDGVVSALAVVNAIHELPMGCHVMRSPRAGVVA